MPASALSLSPRLAAKTPPDVAPAGLGSEPHDGTRGAPQLPLMANEKSLAAATYRTNEQRGCRASHPTATTLFPLLLPALKPPSNPFMRPGRRGGEEPVRSRTALRTYNYNYKCKNEKLLRRSPRERRRAHAPTSRGLKTSTEAHASRDFPRAPVQCLFSVSIGLHMGWAQLP